MRIWEAPCKMVGNIYTKDGMSPDPEKCKIIKEWPLPKACNEVKSFLQTVQFNAKFLGGKVGQASYPEVTETLRILTRKNTQFFRRPDQAWAFQELKDRLCSDDVMVRYNTTLNTRLYVDSSPVGTQATVAQKHIINGEVHWRLVIHRSRSWTSAEAGYGQIEQKSNGILTGMYMNRMYTLGTHTEVVTDHEPLNSVDRHRTKHTLRLWLKTPTSTGDLYRGSETAVSYWK